MASPEDTLIQQASVDYLQQINQNVVSLNSTASAQREISERQLASQESTKNVMDEVKGNIASSVHNQAYMAYGTFQHDTQQMVGFTDSATRTALATMNIAGRHFVSDAGSAYESVSNASSGGVSRIMEFAYPEPIMNQGMTGSLFAMMGVKRGPESVYQKEYEELSRRQMGLTWDAIGSKATLRFGRAGAIELGQEFDPFAYRLRGNEYKPLSEEEVMRFGGASQNVVSELTGRGITKDRATEVARIGMETAFRRPEINPSNQDAPARIESAVREFGQQVVKLNESFKMNVTDMAKALSDFSSSTGMGVNESAAFLQKYRTRFQGMGLTPEESVRNIANAQQFAVRAGSGMDTGFEQYTNIYEMIRRRSATNQDYSQLVSRLGGAENVAATTGDMNNRFMKSGLGLMYTAAAIGGGQQAVAPGTPIASIAMKAGTQLAGGAGAILDAMYYQTYGFKGKDALAMRGQANIYLETFRQVIPDATEENVKSDPTMQRRFKAFLQSQIPTLQKGDDIDAFFEAIFQLPKSGYTSSSQTEEDVRMVEQRTAESKAAKRKTLGGKLSAAKEWFFGGGNPASGEYSPQAEGRLISNNSVLGPTTQSPDLPTSTRGESAQSKPGDYYDVRVSQMKEVIESQKQMASELIRALNQK